MFQSDYAVWLLSDTIKPPLCDKVLIDWPRHDFKTYLNYLHACSSEGLPIGMVEMMNWGCETIQLIGRNDSQLIGVAHTLYNRYAGMINRDHDVERVVELILEVVELLYCAYWSDAPDFFETYRQVWVTEVTKAGVFLEAYIHG